MAGGDIEATWFSALASQDSTGSFGHATVLSFKWSVVLAKSAVA
jgi:hypothetical protein